jgi:hypothetical protein
MEIGRGRYQTVRTPVTTRGGISLALYVTSFLSFLWNFYALQSTSPRTPQPQLGRVHQLNNHGSFFYLTDEEATAQSFLLVACILSFGLCMAGVSWRRRGPFDPDPDLPVPVPRKQKAIALASASVWLAFIRYAGPHLVHFAVSRGLVLSFG